MEFTHISDGQKTMFKPDDEFSSFLISDRSGGYFSQGIEKNHTFYHGMLSQYPEDDEWTMFKFIERINIPAENIEKENTTINFLKGEGKTSVRFIRKNTIEINSESDIEIEINIDPRKIYDFTRFGRSIKIKEEDDMTILEYKKKDDHEKEEYSLFLGLKGADRHEFLDEWIKRDYEFDKRRGGDKDWHIHKGIRVKFNNQLIIAQHHSKEELKKALNSEDSDIRECTGYLSEKISKNMSNTYACAVNSADDLIVDDKGMYAGFYWFFQFWTRDEAISLGGLIWEERRDLVKKILKRHLDNILGDGRVANRFPHSGLGSADGIGWAVKRVADSIRFFDNEEVEDIKEKLEKSMRSLEDDYKREGVFINAPKETWMDTNGGTDDVRDGTRVEIQALMLNFYNTLYHMTGKDEWRDKENDMRERTRELLFKNGQLADGADENLEIDWTIRPNIFLAYYVYPKLLEEEQWRGVFDLALEKLWLPWGGLATIDVDNELFQHEYTGENDLSYHRGDSWYFVNNIAAISMLRLDEDRYKKEIDKIFRSSEDDLLYKGILGASSEVSSAKEQRAEGTWQQAWSSCTLIELIHEMHRN